MIVIADTSPLVVLVKIMHTEILPSLFGSIVLPPAVVAELADVRRPQIVRDFIASPPPWLWVRRPSAIESIPGLDEGERQAISLARELGADLLLMDEEKGRATASHSYDRHGGNPGAGRRPRATGPGRRLHAPEGDRLLDQSPSAGRAIRSFPTSAR
jgi:hypothetical protein